MSKFLIAFIYFWCALVILLNLVVIAGAFILAPTISAGWLRVTDIYSPFTVSTYVINLILASPAAIAIAILKRKTKSSGASAKRADVMNSETAERVVREYGAVLASASGSMQPASVLPYPKEEIQNAIKLTISSLCESGDFTEKMKNALEIGYVSLAEFLPQDQFDEFKLGDISSLSERIHDSQALANAVLVHGERTSQIMSLVTAESARLLEEIRKFEAEQESTTMS